MGKNKGNVPIRTCIACGAKRSKKELVRLALNAQGSVIRDDAGNVPGRGAYVCPSESCWEKVASGKGLSKAFRRAGLVIEGF